MRRAFLSSFNFLLLISLNFHIIWKWNGKEENSRSYQKLNGTFYATSQRFPVQLNTKTHALDACFDASASCSKGWRMRVKCEDEHSRVENAIFILNTKKLTTDFDVLSGVKWIFYVDDFNIHENLILFRI